MAADCGREVWEWCRGFLIQNKVLVDIKTNSEASRELSYCGNISPSQSEMTSPSSRAQTPCTLCCSSPFGSAWIFLRTHDFVFKTTYFYFKIIVLYFYHLSSKLLTCQLFKNHHESWWTVIFIITKKNKSISSQSHEKQKHYQLRIYK